MTDKKDFKLLSDGTLRSSHQRCSVTKCFLRNFAKFAGKHLCQSLFIKRETLTQVFCCEFCKISKNTYFIEHLRTAASEHCKISCTTSSFVLEFFGRTAFPFLPKITTTDSSYKFYKISLKIF